MGKNHQHKKKLKAEKAKIKLKQTSKTKFLPKGQNVTNTLFKIKPIVLQEQLKSRSSEDILSKRKLNITDLLNRLKHYNENVKHSACEELSEVINLTREEIIHQNIAPICLAASSLMQDDQHKVRKGAVKVINSILVHVSNDKLQPFLGYFSTNLRCAMTNIDRSIQEDSLMFLDSFLSHNCDLIKQNSGKILPDFFTLISKIRSDSNLERTVTVNLGSKMTSVTWRIKVLSRLHTVLKMVLLGGLNHNIDRDISPFLTHDINNLEDNLPLYKHSLQKSFDVHVFNKFVNRLYTPSTNSSTNIQVLNKHIITLVPLLYETWLEAVPERKVDKTSSESTTLSDEAASILTCIVNTLYLLWQYVKEFGHDAVSMKTVFLSDEGKKFFKHILSNFPYCQGGGKKPNKKSSNILDVNEDPKCVQENLLISLIYSVLCVNFLRHNVKNELQIIMSYITRSLFTKSYMNGKNISYLIEFLEECFGNNSQKWIQARVDLGNLLDNTVFFYDHGKVDEENKLKIFNILSDVNDSSFRTEKYTQWLTTLPEILCQSRVTDIQVKALLRLCKKNCLEFQVSLLKAIPNILGNLKHLDIVVIKNEANYNENAVVKDIINMIYYLPKLCTKEILCFQDFMKNEEKYSSYLHQVFELRCEYKAYAEELCLVY